MAVDTTIEIAGIKDALRALNGIDKSARRDLTRRYKEVMSGVVTAIQQAMPKNAPMSGFNRSWDPSGKRPVSQRTFSRDIVAGLEAQERRESGANQILPYGFRPGQITAGVSGKKPRRHATAGFYSHLATFYIRANNASLELFDMAGKAGGKTKQGEQMIRVLTARFGKPSRVMWPIYEQKRPSIEDAVRRIVDDLMRRVNDEMR